MSPREILDRLSEELSGRKYLANVWLEEGLRAESPEKGPSELERWNSGYVTLEVELSPGRVGFAEAPAGEGGFDPAGLLERALASGAVMGKDRFSTLPEEIETPPEIDLGIEDGEWPKLTAELAGELSEGVRRACLGYDRRVFSARKPAFEGSRTHRAVAVEGSRVYWTSTEYSLSVEGAARKGKSAESAWASRDFRKLSLADPAAVGEEAARRACELLGGKSAPTGSFPALIDARVAGEFLEVLAPSLLGRNRQKGKSLFRGAPGESVFAKIVTIVDDGVLPGGMDTQPVDEEGSARRRNPCVEEGVLRGFLYDRSSGLREGRESTGNGSGSPGSAVAPDVTNFFIAPGTGGSPAELLAAMGRGLWVREVMGAHTIDPVSGDYSLGCSGLWIEGGKVSYPVTGAAIAGNILDLFRRVEAVGSDLTFNGSLGAPSLLVGGLDISG